MENLVIQEGKQALTTSFKVAEIFEKKHKNVLRDIAKTIQDLSNIVGMKAEIDRLKFERISYIDVQGCKQKLYLRNRDILRNAFLAGSARFSVGANLRKRIFYTHLSLIALG